MVICIAMAKDLTVYTGLTYCAQQLTSMLNSAEAQVVSISQPLRWSDSQMTTFGLYWQASKSKTGLTVSKNQTAVLIKKSHCPYIPNK